MNVLTDMLKGHTLNTPLGYGQVEEVDYQFNVVYVKVKGNWHDIKSCKLVVSGGETVNALQGKLEEVERQLTASAETLRSVKSAMSKL